MTLVARCSQTVAFGDSCVCALALLSMGTYMLAVSAAMTGLVGISRVTLGVHWATDVMAGWAFGAAWAMAWLLLARRIARTGTP